MRVVSMCIAWVHRVRRSLKTYTIWDGAVTPSSWYYQLERFPFARAHARGRRSQSGDICGFFHPSEIVSFLPGRFVRREMPSTCFRDYHNRYRSCKKLKRFSYSRVDPQSSQDKLCYTKCVEKRVVIHADDTSSADGASSRGHNVVSINPR